MIPKCTELRLAARPVRGLSGRKAAEAKSDLRLMIEFFKAYYGASTTFWPAKSLNWYCNVLVIVVSLMAPKMWMCYASISILLPFCC